MSRLDRARNAASGRSSRPTGSGVQGLGADPSEAEPQRASPHSPRTASAPNETDGLSDAWPLAARRLIESLSAEVLSLRARIADLEGRAAQAEALADTDTLTPALNRRAFLREVQKTLAFCRRYNESASILFLDMDGFKRINDTFGHAAGDAALIRVCELLMAQVRESDSVGRLGGDEFAVLLQHADLDTAHNKALHLEDLLNRSVVAWNGLEIPMAGSFGVRAFAQQDSAEQWLAEADALMFLNKKNPR
ncbi:MAG: GGDEF domain-containing protein [Asticcacaulis sp.]